MVNINDLATFITEKETFAEPKSTRFQYECTDTLKALQESQTVHITKDEHGKVTKYFVQVEVEPS